MSVHKDWASVGKRVMAEPDDGCSYMVIVRDEQGEHRSAFLTRSDVILRVTEEIKK